MVGELHIGGAGVARGYRNQPALTAARFIAHPWRPGARLFRTGDLARRGADGAIILLGRRDGQIKIRGCRIEPGEIEGALETHPAIRQAVVQAQETAPGELRLVAHYVADRPCTPEALRDFLASRLPDFMVPVVWIEVPTLPLTPSGKLDRRALPMPASASLDRPPPPHRDPAAIIAALVADAIGRPAPAATDRLARHGLDSLGMMHILAGLEDMLGIAVEPADITPALFESLASLTAYARCRQPGLAA
jgi:acyl carrier protein